MAGPTTPIIPPEPRHGGGPHQKQAEIMQTIKQVYPLLGKHWWKATVGRTTPTMNREPPPSTDRKVQQASCRRDGRCCVLLQALHILQTTTLIPQRGRIRGALRRVKVCKVGHSTGSNNMTGTAWESISHQREDLSMSTQGSHGYLNSSWTACCAPAYPCLASVSGS
jgi:hypothetical protein